MSELSTKARPLGLPNGADSAAFGRLEFEADRDGTSF